jgi:hypothetical protein
MRFRKLRIAWSVREVKGTESYRPNVPLKSRRNHHIAQLNCKLLSPIHYQLFTNCRLENRPPTMLGSSPCNEHINSIRGQCSDTGKSGIS